MTDTGCWIFYKSDRELQKKVEEGWFTDQDHRQLPIDDFPPCLGYWPIILMGWCEKRGIKYEKVDGLTYSAKVKKDQIEDFIQYVYGGSESYSEPAQMLAWKGQPYLANRLTNLRAFVAKQLNPEIWYELMADDS